MKDNDRQQLQQWTSIYNNRQQYTIIDNNRQR